MKVLEMIRGTSHKQSIKILKDGVPYIPNAGEVFRFGVKESCNSSRYLIKKEIKAEDMNDGQLTIEIMPEETARLPIKTYKWDLGLQNGRDYQNIIPYSDLILQPNVTTWEDLPNEQYLGS